MKESSRQHCARLVSALADLADQEAASLRARDFAAVLEIQRRAAPIVADLESTGPAAADQSLRNQLSAVLRLRENTVRELQAQIEDAKQQIDSLDVSKRRVSKVAPVYGGHPPRRNRLSAMG